MRAILVLFGVVCLITGCGEGDSSEVPSTAPETGHESASAACTGFVEALNGQRWDAVASAISPSQRGAVAVWLSKGVRNMLAILEMTAEPKPTVDPAAANKQAQDIWTSAGVDAADQMATLPAGLLAEGGLELADRMVASASGILKAVQVGDTWFMSVVLNP